jgi:hypothetical protein
MDRGDIDRILRRLYPHTYGKVGRLYPFVNRRRFRMPHVNHEFRTTSRYMSIGVWLSFCPGDEDGPNGISARLSLVWFHYELYVEWD